MCEDCDHKKDPDGGHCYMFAEAPDGPCGQFTVNGVQQHTQPTPLAAMSALRHLSLDI
jgi:hypothetical protein